LGRACVSFLISLLLNLDPLSVVYLEFVRLDTSQLLNLKLYHVYIYYYLIFAQNKLLS